MSNTTELEAQLESIVADRLRVEVAEFDDSTEFEDLEAESLDMVEIAEAIEADVGVHIPDEDLAEIDTVADLKSYVADRV
ncbi:acyl carrier protein [Natrialbaceae archaeon A-gly3]